MRRLLILKFVCAFLTTGYTQDIGDNSNLKQHRLFGLIELGIPESVKRLEANKDAVEEMGFANFSTADEKIDIKTRKMDEVNLAHVKELMDGLSSSMYNGTILRSEVVKINNIDFFVTDIKGQWNGKGDVIGMFRYYFNAKGNSYNLLMRYPVDLIDKTKNLREKMLRSIKIVQ